jgi:hypothetical protein
MGIGHILGKYTGSDFDIERVIMGKQGDQGLQDSF